MMTYPESLRVSDNETLLLPNGNSVLVPKSSLTFEKWNGTGTIDSYGGKTIIDLDGEALFAELAILRTFEKYDWHGVWVDTYRRRYRTQFSNSVELPEKIDRQIMDIYENAGSRNGCWDVLCWKGEDIVIAESKRRSRDRIRNSQLIWLESALKIGMSLDSFLIVQWTLQ